MAVPKKRTSKQKKHQRRSHNALKPPSLARCAYCGSAIMPHRVCHNCGHYGEKEVVQMEEI